MGFGFGKRREAHYGYGLALRKSFTIGTMMGMRCISVTWVVSGKMANRDAERGFSASCTRPQWASL